MADKKLTIQDIGKAKEEGRKLVMTTAYDYPFALMAEEAGVDILLVGDSLGMVVLGMDSTVAVTMAEMVHHCKAAARGCRRALLIGDMPFMSYNISVADAIANAGRLIKEGGCDAVKLEGGEAFADTVAAVVRAGIPVQGHIGLTPQTASTMGGYTIQGRDAEAARRIMDDARAWRRPVFSRLLSRPCRPLWANCWPRRSRCRSSVSAPVQTWTVRCW